MTGNFLALQVTLHQCLHGCRCLQFQLAGVLQLAADCILGVAPGSNVRFGSKHHTNKPPSFKWRRQPKLPLRQPELCNWRSMNKPPIFEHSTVEAEIKAFRDWSWQVSQYLATIDSSYDDELKKVFDNPSSKLDMESASVETRTRNMILYGLLASLVRGKALNIVKIVGTSDGYEALRHMVLALRPNNNNKTTNNRQRQRQ